MAAWAWRSTLLLVLVSVVWGVLVACLVASRYSPVWAARAHAGIAAAASPARAPAGLAGTVAAPGAA